jgi:hypothetical protein
MNGIRVTVPKNVMMKLFSGCFSKVVAFVTSLGGRAAADETPRPHGWIEQTATSSRVIPFGLPKPTPTATIGPCLTCHCGHVNVTLLTSHVRYCRCPNCGSSWTEPAKSTHPTHHPSFQSEPLKFLRDRN